MKSRHHILILASIMGLAEFAWYNAQADQQTSTDAGVDFAKSLLGDVQNLSTSTNVNTVPSYGGTNLPETQYYNNQDLNGMQTDAVVDLQSGAASEVSQYAYQKSMQPKLQFAPNDPILQNAGTISTGAVTTPDVLTVQTGNCGVADVSTTETRTETCTAWLQPSTQTCNKTLNVDVTWESVSSCPISTTFSQNQTLHNAQGTNDYVYARAYCNPGSGDGFVDLQVDASDGDPNDCTDWTGITVSTNQPTPVYSGALLKPAFDSSGCETVPTFIQGGCDANNQCNYTVTYHELRNWSAQGDGDPDVCYGTAMDLAALGYPGPGSTFHYFLGNDPQEGYYCVARSSSVNLTFEKPHITQTPTVTDTWNDGCGFLEAQVK